MKQTVLALLVSFLACIGAFLCKGKICGILMPHANFGVSRAVAIKQIDKLFIGSSMFRQGIDLGTISSENEVTYLLAYNGNQPILELEEMRHFYDLGGKAKCLIVDMYAYALVAKPALSDARVLLDDTNGHYILRLYEQLKKGNANWLVLYQMAFQANNELLATVPFCFGPMNRLYDNGGNLGERAGTTEERLSQLPLLKNNSQINQAQAEALQELIELCVSQNTQVIFVETPKYFRVIDTDKAYIYTMQCYVNLLQGLPCDIILYDKTLARIEASKSSIQTYSFDNSVPEYFSDLIHLSSNGRKIFTCQLMNVL